MEKRVEPIRITIGDVKYTLEFNRKSVREAEKAGFRIDLVTEQPMAIAELFYHAFRMHHKNMTQEKADEILFGYLGGIEGMDRKLIERLALLYAEPFKAHEDNSKNVEVSVEY